MTTATDKTCCSCGCPLLEELLPGDPEERCEHCGDYDERTEEQELTRLRRFGSRRPCEPPYMSEEEERDRQRYGALPPYYQ